MEQPVDPTAGLPPNTAAVNGGSSFDLMLIVWIIVGVLVLWAAREPVRRVVWQIFFITGRLFGRWGLWLKEHGQAAKGRTAEKIAAQRADELQERMIVLEDRIGKRAEKLSKETTPIIAKLDKSTHAIATTANDLSEINFEDAAERAFRAAMPSIEQGRNLSKLERNIAQNTARAMNERVQPLRPALSTLKTEAPKLKAVAEQLAEIDQTFNQGVEQVNKTFADFEECLRSEDRIKAAGKHSIVIPWLIAVFITAIALSGVFLNFFLIERPMSEIVGEGSRIGGISLPQFAAMIVIFLEFVAGVILMDAAGFTKLIPAFHGMTDRGRKIMFWAAFGFLVAFSVLEATLAIARERIIEMQAEDSRIAAQLGAGLAAPATPDAAAPEAAAPATTAPADTGGIFGIGMSTFAQLILAILIPWLLATAALPLEVIIRNSVFMMQIAGAHLMLAVAFICKTLAVGLKNLGLFALTIYDLIIFAPLWIERRVKGMNRHAPRRKAKPDDGEGGEDGDIDELMLNRKSTQNQQKPPKRERERGQRELENA